MARGKIAGLQDNAREITLSLLCLSLGPLVYAASLATVAAMLVLTMVTLIVSRQDSVSIILRTVRVLVAFAPLLLWMLASAAWSLDGAASVEVTLRVAVLFLSGTLLVTSFALLPLEQLRRPLIAVALGFSGAAVVVVVDLELGGHLARFLHEPRLNGVDPALGYGRAATLHATLLAPVLVGLVRLGFLRLAVGFALLAAAAILETASLSAKTALAASLLVLIAVWLQPRLRWIEFGVFGFAVVALPLMFPLPLGAQATCWLADHKASAAHRLEIWSFVAEHIRQRPIAGWGLDAARRLPGGTAQVIIHHCDDADRPDGIALSSQTLPLHPHNAILQVWLELGGVGVALGFGPLVFAIWRAFRNPEWRTRPAQAMIAATAAATVSVGLVSFGIWQEWFLSGLFIAAAFAVLAARLSGTAVQEPICPGRG
ncbi:MAG TPA: O-antigen ligase family protein [Stellaceae bacterium]|nr:O-antigen ligase family protein [Stellaceae bacterium]